jgi:signal transduction histidine kinase
LSARLSFPRHSFRWQITLLGAVVVVLFVAVLMATLVALQYTKSAVLNGEKRRLIGAASALAGDFMDKARSASQKRRLSHADFGLVSSPEAVSEISETALQRIGGVAGGFYQSDGDFLLGYAGTGAQANEQPTPSGASHDEIRSAILEAARSAAIAHLESEKILTRDRDFVLIEAVPISDENASWGSAWTMERLQSLPGANRLRAYLITVALGVAALVCVILTLLVVRNLQAGVRKIEEGLQGLESDLASQIPTGSDPEEIQRIAQAVNRLGSTLKANIDREKQIEDRLRHAERLAALGRLVAGVAHEVRNPLATIRLRLQMAQREARNPRVDESCSIAFEEIDRLNGMVNRLLNFARPVRLEPESTNLAQLTEQRLSRFVENAERNHIQIVRSFPQDGTWLSIDRNKMAQVFDNVIQNAIEAMTESGGTLWVSVTSEVKSVSGTDRVRVEFRDTGNGISSSLISRVFDPFFTTKPSGTGLGLSICHEFVRAHRGEIQVESAEGDGTRVRIILPIVEDIPDNVQVS